MFEKQPAVYILASKKNGVLYTGVTSNLVKRIWEHKQGLAEGFSKKYNVKQLVYFELHDDMYAAIVREKNFKKWKRDWKLNLIDKLNPEWIALWDKIL